MSEIRSDQIRSDQVHRCISTRRTDGNGIDDAGGERTGETEDEKFDKSSMLQRGGCRDDSTREGSMSSSSSFGRIGGGGGGCTWKSVPLWNVGMSLE